MNHAGNYNKKSCRLFYNVLKQMVLCPEPTNRDDYDWKPTFDKEDRLLQWLVVKHWNAIWIGIY